MKQWIWLILSLLITSLSFAQGGLGLTCSYFGENIIHPGLKVGLDYTLKEEIKVKTRRNQKRAQKHGAITKRKQLFVTGNAAFYNHPNNHSGLLFGAEIGRRRIKESKGKAKLHAFSLGLGYLQRIYNIDTYTLNEDDVLEQFKGGQAQFFTAFSASFGRVLSINDSVPITYFIKPTVFLLLPYSHSLTFNAALEIGIIYQLQK